ncbi:MFS transporter [Lewinella cohaerens]|uniref:MFS transporter n=1 Tax=Lewinella cohaerens TaxID=70995 RepID=UPI0003773519|nr:MFS transporter [Lewinella cohaerens]
MIKNENLLILLLAALQFTHIVDFMIMMPLGKQFMELYDINPQQFSLLVSAYAFAAFAAGLFGAMFIDRFDRRHALLVVYLGFTIGTLACAFAPSYGIFLASRAFTGAFGGTLGALILAVIGDIVPFQRRGAAIGKIMISFSAASIAGVPAGIFLADEYGTSAPFLVVGALSCAFLVLSYFVIPPLRHHFQQKDGVTINTSPREIIRLVSSDPNQLRALLFSLVLMLGHFTIIPFIAPYMQLNIGFTSREVALLYAIGGAVTVICLPLFGRLADRFGHILIFTLSSILALFSIFAITNLPPVILPLALMASASFFLVASGRNVPATTLVTSVVKPESRGSFMSIRASINEAGLALSSFIAGMIVIENPDGSLGHYQYVGYFAIIMSVVAIILARKLKTVS